MNNLKRRAIELSLVLATLGILGFMVAVAGIVPIDASSGHWSITNWFLHFSMQRSIRTHTFGMSSPPLDLPGLVVKGATHYEVACRTCHGSPRLRAPLIAQKMLPPPPYLPATATSWEPTQLFYVVKHGVKFTGMPAWPSQHRDDEVWAMVAFLRSFPALDAGAYEKLTHVASPPIATTGSAPLDPRLQDLVRTCARCHGVDGLGGNTDAFPILAGQRREYLAAALEAYRNTSRHSGIMDLAAAELTPESMRALADHYAAQKPPPPAIPRPEHAQAIARGEVIARRGIPAEDVPACVACHGPGATRRNPAYPLLAGQHASYLSLQLTLFKQQSRGGSAYAHLMSPVAAALTAQQMDDVAQYYASLAATTP